MCFKIGTSIGWPSPPGWAQHARLLYLAPMNDTSARSTTILPSGLSVRVGAGKRLRRDDGKLQLRSAPPSVQKMIEITGLDATLPRI